MIPPEERIGNWNEFQPLLSQEEQQKQGARCMDCGVPFCQSGMMFGGHGIRLSAAQPDSRMERPVSMRQLGAGLLTVCARPTTFRSSPAGFAPRPVRSRLLLRLKRRSCDLPQTTSWPSLKTPSTAVWSSPGFAEGSHRQESGRRRLRPLGTGGGRSAQPPGTFRHRL